LISDALNGAVDITTSPGVISSSQGTFPMAGMNGEILEGDSHEYIMSPGTSLSFDAATRLLASSTGMGVTLPLFTNTKDGLAPLSGGGTANFLRADGTWAAPGAGASITVKDEGSNLTTAVTSFDFTGAGVTASAVGNAVTVNIPSGGAGTNLSYTASTRLLASDTGTDVTLPLFTSTEAGLTPLSGGGTTNYLRADGTWSALPTQAGTTNLGYTDATRILTSDTGTDVTLPLVTTSNPGLAPATGGGTTTFLRADASWAVPVGVTNLSYTASTRILASDTGTDATLPLFTTTEAGLTPLSGGGTTNYLRADGTWAALPSQTGTTNLGYTASTRVLTSDTGTDVTLPLVTSTEAGLAPLSGGGTTNYLRADGTWAALPTQTGTTNLGYTASTRILTSDTGTDVTLPLVTSTEAGLAPLSGGGTSNFLRADGTWATPAGGSGLAQYQVRRLIRR
jgi:hypothetical protein